MIKAFKKVKIDNSGCWIWTGEITSGGYGRLRRDGKLWTAHRFFYTKLVGKIPEGKQLDHLCRVRKCVNPKHLEPVTPKENVLRGIGLAAIWAKRTHCNSGHEFTKENTRIQVFISNGKKYKSTGRVCKSCHREKMRLAMRKKLGCKARI